MTHFVMDALASALCFAADKPLIEAHGSTTKDEVGVAKLKRRPFAPTLEILREGKTSSSSSPNNAELIASSKGSMAAARAKVRKAIAVQ